MTLDGEPAGATEATVTLEPGQSKLLVLRQTKARAALFGHRPLQALTCAAARASAGGLGHQVVRQAGGGAGGSGRLRVKRIRRRCACRAHATHTPAKLCIHDSRFIRAGAWLMRPVRCSVPPFLESALPVPVPVPVRAPPAPLLLPHTLPAPRPLPRSVHHGARPPSARDPAAACAVRGSAARRRGEEEAPHRGHAHARNGDRAGAGAGADDVARHGGQPPHAARCVAAASRRKASHGSVCCANCPQLLTPPARPPASCTQMTRRVRMIDERDEAPAACLQN